MAKQIVVRHVDDITGEDIPQDMNRELSLSFQGLDYVLDVAPDTLEEVSAYMTQLLANVKPVKGRKRRRTLKSDTSAPASNGATNGTTRDNSAVRQWAKENGFDVKARGRVEASIIEAYDKAMAAA